MINRKNEAPEFIKTSLDGQIGRLTFSNPDKFNALPLAGWSAIPAALDHLINQGARVAIVAGEGENFCSGADISEFDTVRKDPETAKSYEQSNIDAFAALRDASVPTIASIRGFCLGGGFGLAAACDLRLSDDTAKFAVPAARLGLGYPVDAMADIVNAVGVQFTKQMLFTARRYGADEMNKRGFLGDVLPTNNLEQATTTLAQEIATLAPKTHQSTKASINAALGGDKTAAQKLGDETFASEDYAEGRRAFLEKRRPVFVGR